jgi:hypothetical protein
MKFCNLNFKLDEGANVEGKATQREEENRERPKQTRKRYLG